MDQDELENLTVETSSSETISEDSFSIQPSKVSSIGEESLSQPDQSHFDKLANQRKEQRDVLFWFSIRTATIALLFLIVLISAQAISRFVKGDDFSLLSGFELEILSVSIFGQIISVIALITRSLWDERPLKEIYRKDHENKHNGLKHN